MGNVYYRTNVLGINGSCGDQLAIELWPDIKKGTLYKNEVCLSFDAFVISS